MWKVYSQPWSAWPRAFQGRFVTVKGGAAVLVPLVVVVVVVAIVRDRGRVRDGRCLAKRLRVAGIEASAVVITAIAMAKRYMLMLESCDWVAVVGDFFDDMKST